MTIASVLGTALFSVVVPLGFTASFLILVWGSFLYILGGTQDEEMREKGKSIMLYGVIVLVIVTAVWGLLALIARSLAHT